jgi:hypothetical protein
VPSGGGHHWRIDGGPYRDNDEPLELTPAFAWDALPCESVSFHLGGGAWQRSGGATERVVSGCP